MLNKIGEFILKYKGAVLLAMSILLVITIIGTVFLVIDENKINSDMVSYLDDDSYTKRGLVFLQDKFDIRGNATLVVRVNENLSEEVSAFNNAVKNISQFKEVSSITWHGSVSSYEQLDTGLDNILSTLNENRAYLEELAQTLKEKNAYDNANEIITLIGLADYFGVDFVETSVMQSYLRHETSTQGVYDYVLIILTDVEAGDAEYELLNNIKAEFNYTRLASTGTTETAQRLLSDTMGDLPWFIICAVVSVLIILLLCTKSFAEPFILLFTLIVGIVISMGMNYLYPSISIISFAISAVLQLAITMDYAIFYMHAYRKNRAKYDVNIASANAFPEVAESVLASGFTTIGGFVALYCMDFKIGTDIANVLVKGVLMSIITVLLLQPILTVLCDNLIMKTSHNFTEKINIKINNKRIAKGKKEFILNNNNVCRPIAKFAVWQRILLIIIAVALIVPSFIAQSKAEYSYLQLYEKSNETEEEKLANELGNQLIIAVPIDIVKKDGTHKEFVEEIKSVNDKRITGILGAFTAVDIDANILKSLLTVASDDNVKEIESLKLFLEDESYSEMLTQYGIYDENIPMLIDLCDEVSSIGKNMDLKMMDSVFRKVNGKWYTLYTISFNGNTEDKEAQKAYEEIINICSRYFGKNSFYPVGMITSSYEMSTITPHDFLVVTLVSIAIIYAVVTILLRNPLKSLIIIAIIELGIWINLAFVFILGETVNFVVYVIISSVQLGCTVDYAILYANTFEKNRSKYTTGKECAIETATETISPILTSALMIGSVCFGMYLISSNIVIKQLTGMLARGALISFILVVFVQTSIWSFFKTERKNRHYEEKLMALENNMLDNKEKQQEEIMQKDVFKNEKLKKTKNKKLSASEKLVILEGKENKNNDRNA